MSFRYPLDVVNFTQNWGDNPDYYKQYGQLGHNGTDISCAIGTPVYAADDGVIYYEGQGVNQAWMGSIAGICCIIDHGSVYTGYAHLSNTVINKGQTVTKGQLIGHSGMTGVGTGPHLHFEFIAKPVNIKNGYYGRVDPAGYLTNKGEDMIDQPTLTILFNTILGRDAEPDAISHYVGNYTTSFVVNDLYSSPEHATHVANLTSDHNNVRTQLSNLNGQITALNTQLVDMQNIVKVANDKSTALATNLLDVTTRLADMTAQYNASVKRLNIANETVADLQGKLSVYESKPVIECPKQQQTVGEWFNGLISAIFRKRS